MKSPELTEFFSLLGKAKKEKKEEFNNLLKEADINLDALTSTVVSGIKEAKVNIKKQKKKEEKLIEQLDSIIDVIENPKEVKDITEPAVTVGVPEDFDVSTLEIEDADNNPSFEVVDIIKPEPIKTPKISDTVAQAIKFIEETNIKEEIENSDEPSLDKLKTEIKQVRDILYKVLAHGPGSGEVNLLKLDDVDEDSAKVDGKFLKYDASSGKFVGGSGGAGSQNLNDTLGLGNTSVIGMSVGVITATSFVGDGSQLTNVGSASTANVRTGILDVAGIATFRNDTLIGSGVTLSPDGDIFATGVTTSTSFVGDLTGDVTGTASNATQLNSQAASYYLNYNNFTNTPTIPSNNNQLTNGAGFITASDIVNTTGVITASQFSGFSHLIAPYASTKTITVKVASKVSGQHRYYGSGSSLGYVLDNVQSPFLTLTPGRTYRFDVSDSSNSGHPFRFYLDAAKATAYTTGVTVGSGYVDLEVTDSTPTVLHYQCSSHGYMGNSIQVSSSNAIKLNSQAASYYLDYDNFTNTPTIPTNNNQLTNGAGYITTSFTNTNQLTNGAGFITSSDDITGNAASATILENARTIGGVSFNGSANIDLPGVNSAGNQNTTGTSAGLTGTPNITVGSIVASTGTFSGNVTIGGTLSYEDVTNIDAVGIITANSGIVVGTGVTLSKDGDGFFTGIVTATSFAGDGSALTNLPAGTSDKIEEGNSKVEVVDTGTGSITFVTDGSEKLNIGQVFSAFTGNVSTTETMQVGGQLQISDAIPHISNTGTRIRFPENDVIQFNTNNAERFRIGQFGQFGLSGTNYGSDGQVLTSKGSSDPPEWTTISAGSTADVRTGILDVAGIATFRSNTLVGSGITLSPDGDGFFTGVTTITSSSLYPLQISSGSSAKIKLSGSNNAAIQFQEGTTDKCFLAWDSSGFFYIKNQETNREIRLSNNLEYVRGGTSFKIWNEHNDGSGSGLDADLLDGQEGSYYTNASNLSSGTIPDARFPSALPAIDGSALTGMASTDNVRTGILDVAGISTFRNDIIVGTGITLSPDGNIFATGITTLGNSSSSRVIIGNPVHLPTLSPATRLVVTDMTGNPYYVDMTILGGRAGRSMVKFGDQDSKDVGAISYYHSDDAIVFKTNGTDDKVRITSAGSVTVGSGITLSPDGDIFATGVTTSTSFVGDLTGDVTGTASNATLAVSAQGLTGSPNVTVTNVNAVDAIISGNLSVAGTITSLDQNDILATGIITASSGVDLGDPGIVTLSSDTLTTTSTSADTVASVSATVNRSATFQVQVTRGTQYHMTTINVIHDDTNAFLSEYGTIRTGEILATFDADISGGNLRLRATPTSTASTVFKLSKTTIKV